ncbi:iron-containing alcohol dehydrogenase family protein [Haloechinothrix sp. YIM 98757]|uniref:Iron-containing alcohol dehydrogenase family protein n=1 Tax=Haloechinothrix aidingensis TaxID=2752311 RepID=A0A838A7U1_9PSEU|nr:iron-containing alcohol dehydrogenase family protein [Haloechinothrix aidingensis]MBA0125235.1 iron-containing alcohol dehydrogenase family protein [Haloechinothrix aidingensis]
MPLLARMIESPLTVDIRRGAIDRLGELLADGRISSGGRVAIAVGPGLGDEVASTLEPQLREATIVRVEGGSIDSARELAHSLRESFYDAIIGIGGGQTLDVTKYAASLVGIPMVSVATSLTHDGLASPVASLQHNGRKGSHGVHIPLAVVVDLDYVHRSPARWLRAGIGEAVSNLSALSDWWLAHQQLDATVDGLATAFARSGAEAVLYHKESIESDAFLNTLAQALVLSGLAMSVAGTSQPCSGACHEISHAIDALYPGNAKHGEQVGVGALFATFLRGDEVLGTMDACMRRHGVARLPADIGLTREQFCAAVKAAPSTRPDRYTILESRKLDEDQIRKNVDAFIETFDR